jgi:hypothetical protein
MRLEAAIVLLLAVAAMAGLVIAVNYLWPSWWWHVPDSDLLGLLLVPAVAVPMIILAIVVIRGLRVWHEALQRWAEDLRLPESLRVPTLLLRTGGDEALSALAAVELASGVVTLLLRLCVRLFPVDEGYERGVRRTAWMSPLASVARCVIALLVAPAMGLMIICLGVILVPYCIEVLFAAMSLSITAEATPPGRWQVYHVPRGAHAIESPVRLQHSAQDEPAALKEITRWLSARGQPS